MTMDFDKVQRVATRTRRLRVGTFGLAVGLLAALGSVNAGQVPQQVLMGQLVPAGGAVQGVDPARGVPGAVQVENIDFRRGEGGAGKLVVRFSGDGAMPDLRTQGSQVVVDIAGASLPAELQRPLNVSDFATPVQRIDASAAGTGARLVLNNQGNFESMAYQTGRDFIVEIVPRAAPAAAAAPARAMGAVPAAVAATAQATPAASYRGRPVTFNFQDVPVRTVLQLIAEESNLNIVASDSVQGNVTLRLVSVPWDQALDIVLQSKSLDKRRSGNVIWVAPQAEIAAFEQAREDARINLENRAELVTEYIPINYANAEDLARLMTEDAKSGTGGSGVAGGAQPQNRGFLSPRGSISADRRTNTLLVIDIPQRLGEIRRLIEMLDKPVDQVVIESRIVIANENFARELGAKFGVSGLKNNLAFSGDTDNNTSNFNSRTDTARQNQATMNQYYRDLDAYQGQLTEYNRQIELFTEGRGEHPGARPAAPLIPTLANAVLGRALMSNLPQALVGSSAGALALSVLNAGYALDIELSAMQTEGRGEIISNPRIVTSNQREALIRQGEEIGYLTMTGGTGGQQALPQVEFKDVVLELKVTPTITNDGRVFLAMDIGKDDLAGFISTGVGQVPRISTRRVTTAILVEDGQTVVIGGVYEFNNFQEMRKVPFLADIPVLGNLFRNRNRTRSKAELLVFVTPKVIRVAQR